MSDTIPFDLVGGQFIVLDAKVGASAHTRLILDTGIGVTLLTPALAARAGARDTGHEFVGKRMSGQAVPVPLSELSSLAVGATRQSDALVGVFDLLPGRNTLPPEFATIEGILSPTFFGSAPFTLLFVRRTLVVEDLASMKTRSVGGDSVPLRAVRDGPSLELFTDLRLPNGRIVSVEVDTGTESLILNSSFLPELLDTEHTAMGRTEEKTDETGHRVLRHHARLSGAISLVSAPRWLQPDPAVVFQEIVHDGLLGCDFLRRFTVTFDPDGGQLVVASPDGPV
ncbi:MAG: aspartyl protease family protein [Thermoplasmata archaeon]